jgi:hypothetical protein
MAVTRVGKSSDGCRWNLPLVVHPIAEPVERFTVFRTVGTRELTLAG